MQTLLSMSKSEFEKFLKAVRDSGEATLVCTPGGDRVSLTYGPLREGEPSQYLCKRVITGPAKRRREELLCHGTNRKKVVKALIDELKAISR
jgi:hypothetical protein